MITATDSIKKQLVRIKFLLEVSLVPHLERSSDADSITAIILLDYCVESLLIEMSQRYSTKYEARCPVIAKSFDAAIGIKVN